MRAHSAAARAIAAALLAAALFAAGGCAGTAGHDSDSEEPSDGPVFVVKGTLTYRERIALPPTARAIVECREGTSADGPLVVATASELNGAQVPVSFRLEVPRSRLVSGRFYGVRGAFFVDGTPRWVADSEALQTGADSMNIDPWWMRAGYEGDFRSVLTCGEERVGIRYRPDALLLTVGTETFVLTPVPTASGARYEAASDSTTSLSRNGDRVLVTVRGRRLAECLEENPR
jgi:uncharacterized lipoprotein YbaY